ncbi:MAG: Uma2 family endonuclease [Gemmataceae bacterium]|nr:Uma2 family endonuclease [Gemmataceae bacterium]
MNPVASLDAPPTSPEVCPPDEDKRYELVDGQWVERKMGIKSSRIGAILIRHLDVYAEAQQAGFVMGADGGYKIFPHAPKLVRYPDVSFVRRDRLPNDELPDGHLLIPPDLAVEVVSPNDLAEEIEARIQDYLRARVPLIWVIYPRSRCVRVVRADGSGRQLGEADELPGEDVLPGFGLRVERLFRP